MERLGTEYGGWVVPKDMQLDVVYSGGVGEDISFDIKLQTKYDCNIILIDPTQKAKKHFEECKRYFDDKTFRFTGGIQKDYYSCIENETPNLDKFTYVEEGLWNEKDTLKFYRQENEKYVSQSLVSNMFGKNYDIVPVNTIKNIMDRYGHNRIDLLKIDIEGAEIEVLDKMLDDDIHPKCICVEFDLFLKGKDTSNETQRIINRLHTVGYTRFYNENMNVTFVRGFI